MKWEFNNRINHREHVNTEALINNRQRYRNSDSLRNSKDMMSVCIAFVIERKTFSKNALGQKFGKQKIQNIRKHKS